MNKQQRTMKWLNIFLLIINLSAFGTILFMNSGKASTDSQVSQVRSDQFLKQELNLSDEQYRTLVRLDGDVNRAYQLLLDKQCEFNFAMLEELSSVNPSQSKLDSIANRYGNYQTLLKKQTIRHFMNVRSVCNDEQMVLLHNLLQSMMDLGEKCAECNKINCERRDRISNN
jgi:hypothetical protein